MMMSSARFAAISQSAASVPNRRMAGPMITAKRIASTTCVTAPGIWPCIAIIATSAASRTISAVNMIQSNAAFRRPLTLPMTCPLRRRARPSHSTSAILDAR